MNGNPFVILTVLAVIFFWSRAILQFRFRVISIKELFLWSAVWASALIVLIRPSVTGVVAEKIGIGRGSDAVVYISIISLFYLLFRVYTKADNLEREITALVRALAIERAEHGSHDKN